jgi:hypothetical protein
MKIGICSLAIGDLYKSIVSYGIKSKREYCIVQGYDFIDDETVYDKTRPIAWSKILLLKKYLCKYDYLVWLDADTMITNNYVQMQSIINRYMIADNINFDIPYMDDKGNVETIDRKGLKDRLIANNNKKSEDLNQEEKNDLERYWKPPCFMVGRDPCYINTGVIFVRNCEESYKLLDLIYNQTQFVEGKNDWEQTSFIHCFDKNIEGFHDRTVYWKTPERLLFNSDVWCYRVGHFLVHFMGLSRSQNVWSLKSMMNRFYNGRLDDETQTQYLERMGELVIEKYPLVENRNCNVSDKQLLEKKY